MNDEAGENPPTALEQSPLYPEFKNGETTPDALERVTSATLADVVALEKNLLNLDDANDYIGMNVGVGLSYVIDLLPETSRIFYVGFSGSKGSGKTTATQFCALVAHRGIKLESITFPALAYACSEKMTLCLDEFDAQSERCPELDAIVRQGIALDAKYVKMIPADGKDWTNKLIPCGGMKFLCWKNPIDEALAQRILTIKMSPNATDRVIMNNEAPERFTTPVRQWFEHESRLVHEHWTKDTVRALIEDADGSLERQLSRVATSIPRQKQKTLWMLIVAKLYDWDIEGTIQTLIEKQPDDDLFEEHKQLAREVVEGEFTTLGKRQSFSMPMAEFKRRLDDRCRTGNTQFLRTKGEFSFTGFRRDIGFVEGVNENKRHGGARELKFDARVFKALETELERPRQLTVDEADTTAKIAEAIRMFEDGRTVEEIALAVGSNIVSHCLDNGLIPTLGGRA
jgi:hypothetical protein